MALTARDVLLIFDTNNSFMFDLQVIRYGRLATPPTFVTNRILMAQNRARRAPPRGGSRPRGGSHLGARPAHRLREPALERDTRLPSQHRSRARDIGFHIPQFAGPRRLVHDRMLATAGDGCDDHASEIRDGEPTSASQVE